MFSNNLSSIEGIEIFPIISLVIFFIFFGIIIFRVIKTDKATIKELENIPLAENDKFFTNTEKNNEN